MSYFSRAMAFLYPLLFISDFVFIFCLTGFQYIFRAAEYMVIGAIEPLTIHDISVLPSGFFSLEHEGEVGLLLQNARFRPPAGDDCPG